MAKPRLPRISEDHEDLIQRMRSERNALRKQRLQMLVLLSQEHPLNRQQVADHLAVHRNTIRRWLNSYADGGIEALLSNEQRGPKTGSQRLMSPTVLLALKKRLNDRQGLRGYTELQQWLKQEFGLEVNYKSLYGMVHDRMKAKLKVPRPENPKKK